jgi:hypothetical protein
MTPFERENGTVARPAPFQPTRGGFLRLVNRFRVIAEKSFLKRKIRLSQFEAHLFSKGHLFTPRANFLQSFIITAGVFRTDHSSPADVTGSRSQAVNPHLSPPQSLAHRMANVFYEDQLQRLQSSC